MLLEVRTALVTGGSTGIGKATYVTGTAIVGDGGMSLYPKFV